MDYEYPPWFFTGIAEDDPSPKPKPKPSYTELNRAERRRHQRKRDKIHPASLAEYKAQAYAEAEAELAEERRSLTATRKNLDGRAERLDRLEAQLVKDQAKQAYQQSLQELADQDAWKRQVKDSVYPGWDRHRSRLELLLGKLLFPGSTGYRNWKGQELEGVCP